MWGIRTQTDAASDTHTPRAVLVRRRNEHICTVCISKIARSRSSLSPCTLAAGNQIQSFDKINTARWRCLAVLPALEHSAHSQMHAGAIKVRMGCSRETIGQPNGWSIACTVGGRKKNGKGNIERPAAVSGATSNLAIRLFMTAKRTDCLRLNFICPVTDR